VPVSKPGDLLASLVEGLGSRLLIPELGRRWRVVVALAAATAVALIGLADYGIGPSDVVSVDVLYLVPVTAATILVSTNFGMFIAVECAAVWVWADALEPPTPTAASSIWDGILRVVILAFLVILLSTLKYSLQRTRRSEQQAREFLSYAAHQVRTPLAGIQASSEALILSGLSTDQERLVSVLATDSRRAGKLASSMLHIARLDQGEPYPASEVCVAEVCGNEVEAVCRRLRGRVDIRFTDRCPELVTAVVSPDAVREALANLLDNACRHARSCINVELSAPEDGWLTLTVRDDGPGVPAATEERVFDRFVSLDGADGVGLGLPIARALVETQHGTLAYRNNAFVMSLPVRLPKGRGAARRRL
jgi:signal transduction histidine kinase